MGLFDDIGNTFNKVANTTIKKSKDITELTKLSLKQNTAEGELIKLYEDFGKYQHNVAKNIEIDPRIKGLCCFDRRKTKRNFMILKKISNS